MIENEIQFLRTRGDKTTQYQGDRSRHSKRLVSTTHNEPTHACLHCHITHVLSYYTSVSHGVLARFINTWLLKVVSGSARAVIVSGRRLDYLSRLRVGAPPYQFFPETLHLLFFLLLFTFALICRCVIINCLRSRATYR